MLLAVVLLGCESDAKKYERLRSELYRAEWPLRQAEEAAAKGEPQCPDLTTLPTNAYMRACTDRLTEARTKTALIQRDLNKFMNAR